MQIVNIILVTILVLAIIMPFIFIPIVLIYNYKINSIQARLEGKVTERTVQVFIVWFTFGPLMKSEPRWKRLIETFKRVNNSKDVSDETKKRLYEVYKNRGCNPLAK